jgi:hypothetical protein
VVTAVHSEPLPQSTSTSPSGAGRALQQNKEREGGGRRGGGGGEGIDVEKVQGAGQVQDGGWQEGGGHGGQKFAMETSAAGQHMYTDAVVKTFASATVTDALVIVSAVYLQ